MNWSYLSRWLLHPPYDHSSSSPSLGKGSSTRETPFLCTSRCPAKWALIPPQRRKRQGHRGLLHSPAVCIPRGHRPGPSRHHRWYPRSPGQGSPLSRHRNRPHPPGGAVCCLRREKWDNGAVDLGNEKGLLSCGTLTWAVRGALLWGCRLCWFWHRVIALGQQRGLVSYSSGKRINKVEK